MSLMEDNGFSARQQSSDQTGWRLFRRKDGRLIYTFTDKNGKERKSKVQLANCLPWSRPFEFISIRSDKGKEIRLLESLDGIEEDQKQLIVEELTLRNFLPRITKIWDVEDNAEVFHWRTETTSGPRSFLTRRHERPRQLPTGEVLIRDIYNDMYVIPKPEQLDEKSLRLLWVYLD